MLNLKLVSRRVDAAVAAGLISQEHGARLKATSQAAERYRAGMLCFCLFRPALLPERAASVISYDTGAARRSTTRTIDTLEMGNVIGAIGLPAIVEAEIPLA